MWAEIGNTMIHADTESGGRRQRIEQAVERESEYVLVGYGGE